jgi:Flp pilus assembly protein TadD
MRCTITFALIGLALISGLGGLPSAMAAGPFQKAEPKTAPAKAASTKTGPTPSAEKADQLFSMARLAERQGKLTEARTMYIALIDKFPEHRDAIHRLGTIAVRSGDTDVALEHLGRAEEIGPPTAELLSDIGYALYLQDRLPLAEQKLRAALSMNPQYTAARNNLGIVLGEQRKFDAALAEFRKAGNEAKAYCNLAYVQTKVGALGEAERNYHKALELDGSCKKAAEALVQFESAREKAKRITAAADKPGSSPRSKASEVALASTSEEDSLATEVPEGDIVESGSEIDVQPLPPVVTAPRPAIKAPVAKRPVAKNSLADIAVPAKPVSAPVAKPAPVVEEVPGESLAAVLRKAARATPDETPADLKQTPAPAIKTPVIKPPAIKAPPIKTTRPQASSRIDDGIERSEPIPRVDISGPPANADGTISNPFAQPAKDPEVAEKPSGAVKKGASSKSSKGNGGSAVMRSTDG